MRLKNIFKKKKLPIPGVIIPVGIGTTIVRKSTQVLAKNSEKVLGPAAIPFTLVANVTEAMDKTVRDPHRFFQIQKSLLYKNADVFVRPIVKKKVKKAMRNEIEKSRAELAKCFDETKEDYKARVEQDIHELVRRIDSIEQELTMTDAEISEVMKTYVSCTLAWQDCIDGGGDYLDYIFDSENVNDYTKTIFLNQFNPLQAALVGVYRHQQSQVLMKVMTRINENTDLVEDNNVLAVHFTSIKNAFSRLTGEVYEGEEWGSYVERASQVLIERICEGESIPEINEIVNGSSSEEEEVAQQTSPSV